MNDRSRMSVRGLLSLLVLAIVVGAVMLAYAPDHVQSTFQESVVGDSDATEVSLLLLFAGLVIAVLGIISLWVWRTDSRADRLASLRVESPDRDADVSGTELTQEFHTHQEGDTYEPLFDGAMSTELRNVLVSVYVAEFDNRNQARRHVDAGNWTENRYAAAFISENDDVDYPFRHRIRMWLYPSSAYNYRARQALRETEAVVADRLSSYEAPKYSHGRLDRLVQRLTASEGDQT